MNTKTKKTNPGVYVEQQKKKDRQKLEKSLKTLIHNAVFIPKDNEKKWEALLPYFSENFLDELKHTIIRESLQHLSKKHQTKN